MQRVFSIGVVLFAVIFFPASLVAQAESPQPELKKSFSSAYKSYTNAIKNALPASEIADLALQSLELGKQVYPEGDKTLAVLRQNAGSALVRARRAPEAKLILKTALSNFEKLYGKTSVEIIDTLMTLGHAQQEPYSPIQEKYYRRALKIAEKQDENSSLLVAQLNYDIGTWLLDYAQSAVARNYLKRALQLYRESLPEGDYRIGLSAFYLAKYKMATRKYSQAQELLLEALAIFQIEGQPENTFELAAHAFLVEAYERRGKRKQASQHCQAIGKAQPWAPNQEARAVFKQPPAYPQSALRQGKEGYAILSFTIDENGFAIDPVVMHTEGSKSFGKAALKVVKDWRFVPRFEDGLPAVTPNATLKMIFKMAK